jgi:hypothetical protein
MPIPHRTKNFGIPTFSTLRNMPRDRSSHLYLSWASMVPWKYRMPEEGREKDRKSANRSESRIESAMMPCRFERSVHKLISYEHGYRGVIMKDQSQGHNRRASANNEFGLNSVRQRFQKSKRDVELTVQVTTNRLSHGGAIHSAIIYK